MSPCEVAQLGELRRLSNGLQGISTTVSLDRRKAMHGTMHSGAKWAGAVLVVAVFCAVAPLVYVHVASEALIERRFPLPAVEEPPAKTAKMGRGEHLAAVAGCLDCHGPDLEGRRATLGPLHLWSSNLRIAAHKMTTAEFQRALCRGVAPDATTLWGMPSEDYMYMSEQDVAAIYASLQSFASAGVVRPKPGWSIHARLAVLQGQIVPSVIATRDSPSSLDLGPRYDGGRYLARIACSACHGTDLGGTPGVPDLTRVGTYDRASFFDLLRRGWGAHGRRLPAMYRLAQTRFHLFADYEIMALFDYLSARAHAPVTLFARARANELRRRETVTLEDED